RPCWRCCWRSWRGRAPGGPPAPPPPAKAPRAPRGGGGGPGGGGPRRAPTPREPGAGAGGGLPFGRGRGAGGAGRGGAGGGAEGAGGLALAAERIRGLYGAEAPHPAALRAVERRCRELWDQRGSIVRALGDGLPHGMDEQVRNDLLELAVLGASLRVALAPRGREGAARREALRLLAEAEEELGASPVPAPERPLPSETPGRADPRGARLTPRTS